MLTVRNLVEGESLPVNFRTGFERAKVMPDWAWLAEDEGVPVGVMLAAPCHAYVYLLRLWVLPEYENDSVVLLLFRKFLRDCLDRGFRGYLTHISPMSELERRLIPLCKRAGGQQIAVPQVALMGPIEAAARF